MPRPASAKFPRMSNNPAGPTYRSRGKVFRVETELVAVGPRVIIPRWVAIWAILHAAGQLWTSGVELDWQAFYGEERRRRGTTGAEGHGERNAVGNASGKRSQVRARLRRQ